MLRLVQTSNSLPFSFPVSPSDTFAPGMCAQLKTHGNQIVCGTSDGRVPIGIIDDIKTTSFSAPAIDEIVIAGPIAGVLNSQGQLVTPTSVKVELLNANVYPNSFVSDPVDVNLIPKNGVVEFLAGTVLNLDADGDGIADSIRTRVSYTYQIPNIPGDDSTLSSGRITVWFSRIIFETSIFETSVRYPLGAPLFSNEDGVLTTRQISEDYPGIAIVTGPPTTIFGTLQAMLL